MCSNNVCCSRTWANYCGGNFVPVENAMHEKYFDRSKSAAMSNFCVYTMNFAKCPKKRTSIYTHIELMNTSKCINISWATHRIERKQCYNSFDVMRSELRWLELIEVRCIWFVYFSKTFVVVVFRHFCGFFHSNRKWIYWWVTSSMFYGLLFLNCKMYWARALLNTQKCALACSSRICAPVHNNPNRTIQLRRQPICTIDLRFIVTIWKRMR